MAPPSGHRSSPSGRRSSPFRARLADALDWASARLLIGFLGLLRLLPARFATDLAERVGRTLAPVLPRSRLAAANMARAFPERSADEIGAWVRGVWGNTTRMVGEFVFLDTLLADEAGDRRVEVVGEEHLDALAARGGPAIMFTGHTGNWELLPLLAASKRLRISVLFRPLNNRYLGNDLLAARGLGSEHLVASRAGAAATLSRVLREGGVVGLLTDQWFRRGVPVTFMGRQTRANPLAAKLARSHDAPIYPARCVRLPGGRFRLEVSPPLDPPRDAGGAIDVAATTQAITDVVEGWVREHPDQWLWLHRRWK